MIFALPLAAVGTGEIIGALVALGVAFFAWLRERNAQAKAAPTVAKDSDEPIRGEATREDAEQERMRKFMEALGLPADAATPRRETPPPLRPAIDRPVSRRASIPPVPPITSSGQPFPQRKPPLLPPPIPRAARSLDEAETTTVPAGQIHFPELQTSRVSEFQTVTSAISAIPFERTAAEEISAFNERPAADPGALGREVRALLRSPNALRSALLLREILGPPRGLQGGNFTHTFASP